MKEVKQQVRKEVEMKMLGEYERLKDKIQASNRLKEGEDCPPEVSKVIESIKEKMSLIKIGELHPPFLPKTVTRYRHEYFLPLKRQYHQKINSQNLQQFKTATKVLCSFVSYFDCEMFDIYLQQIREPYIRKIFNQNYEFDKMDFKEISNEYSIRSQIQNLLNSASEWLIQIERTQDLLQRTQLYFDIKTPMIIEKVKKEGAQSHKHRTFGEAFNSTFRNLTSYTLRKSSKVIQSSFFTTLAPATAMLTLAIIGGSATLPWQSDLNGKLLIAPLVAITVPYLLDGLACTLERKQFIQKLQEWAIALEQVASSIAKFNEEVQQTILTCCHASNPEEYTKQKTNLTKYMEVLNGKLNSLTDFSEQRFQQMRDRTEAYFRKYIQVQQEGGWKVVLPPEDYQPNQTDKK